MKKLSATKMRALKLFLLALLFFVLHYGFYLGHYQNPFNGDESFPDWFILANVAGEPFSVEKLTLIKEIKPDYLHPFQKLEYQYSEKNGSEVVVIEREKSLFSGQMEVVKGDVMAYHNEETDGFFTKGFGDREHPNVLFFLVQYLILGGFIVTLIKLFKASQSRH